MSRLNEVKSRQTNVFDEKYEKMYTLGKGNFGKVYLAEERSSGKQFAVKVVEKRLFKSGDQRQHAQRELMISELLTNKLKHENITGVQEVLTENGIIYIVMEFVSGGELFDRIKSEKGLSEMSARKWFKQIISAVEYIHDNNIVHRDLKPENVLIDKNERVKICDFGFGNMIKERHEVLSTYCGSPFYAAPEMVTATPYRGPPVDLWSCGVILYAMLTGALPFQSDEMPQLFMKISRAQYRIPSHVSREASDLIRKLLCKDATERISAKECLMHPWLRPNGLNSLSSQLTLASTFSCPRKRVGALSKESSISTGLTVKTHELEDMNTIKEELNDQLEEFTKKQSKFSTWFLRKKTQIAPASQTSKVIDSGSSDKKALKPKFFFKFTGLLRNSFQKRITDK